MKERLSKLLSIKSIVTILFVVVTLGLSAYRVIVKGDTIPDQIWTIITTVIAFYFGTVAEKENREATKISQDTIKEKQNESK